MSQIKLINLGIFGSYNKTSIGDSAILQGITDQFKENLNSLTVFAFDPEDIKKTVDFNNIKRRIIAGKPTFHKKEIKQIRLFQGNQFKDSIKEYIKNNKFFLKFGYSFYESISLLKNDFKVYFFNKRFWEKIKEEIEGLDLLLIGGGNLVMDLYHGWPIYPLIYTLLARKTKTPVMLYAVGSGPIDSFRAKVYFKIIGHFADSITTRDRNSTRGIRMLGINPRKVITSVDPAVCIDLDRRDFKKPIRTSIGVTVVPYFDKRYWPDGEKIIYKKYVRKMASLVDEIIMQLNYEVLFFTTNFPNDLLVSYDIYKEVVRKDKVFIIEDRLTVKEILSITSKCRIVVGTRLHSLLLSYVTFTPFFAFGYQPKVQYFCEEYWSSNFFTPLNKNLDFSIQKIINELTILLNREEKYRKKMERTLLFMKRKANISKGIALKIMKAN